ncbi:ECF RNA polymerase sigma factor SigK [Arthrobacter sp. L77]|uniref:ECF RNA polymerase sigma factor SigK n=1 Tax=Arthrobacter sp. L77 TaxID=1496689 RepID=UPI00068BB750|nr:ECF RNA polymerase sigma factor SigK [Arthrobacter sp. L77]
MQNAQIPALGRLSPRSPSGPAVAAPGRPGSEVDALLLRVGQGDAQAFEDLYGKTAARVHGLARKVLIDAEMSAETTQDVFLALWQGAAARFDPDLGTGMSWIMTVTHRRAVDKVRSEESHRTRDLTWGIRNRDVDYDQVADAVIQRSETAAVRACLSTLSAAQREAIHLAYYAGLTYLEVAEHLGIPGPTAKTRIRDGIKRLRTSLQEAH